MKARSTMKKCNIIIVYNQKEEKILMCKRTKEPYKGKLNFVGGKVQNKESKLHAAYRELYEETGISKKDITLTHIMNFQYILLDMELEVYAGKIKKERKLIEEENPLLWIDKTENFFDTDKFAGEGNIGHILEHIKKHHDQILR